MNILEFLARFYKLERGAPFVAEAWQKDFLTALYAVDEDGERRHSLALLQVPKKVGKSTTAAGVALYELFVGEAEGEIVVVANSADQARALVFTMLRKAVERLPEMAKRCKILRESITNKETGTTATVLPCSAASVAGRNPSLSLFDELWALPNSEIWYQLTETPARENPLVLVTTYPGYDYDSLLYGLHERGMSGEDPRFLFFWRPGLRSSWITDRYLASQKSRLPSHVYQRLHEAVWAGGSNAAWTREEVEGRIDAGMERVEMGEPGRKYFCGVDVGLRRDRTAAAVVTWAGEDRLELVDMSVWYPEAGRPVLVSEIEAWIAHARRRYPGLTVVADPTAFEGSIQRSAGAIQEVRFTADVVRRLSAGLHEVIAGKVLALYPHEELTKELLTVNAVSSSVGWRIDHDSGRHDDCVIALGLAVMAATGAVQVERPKGSLPTMADAMRVRTRGSTHGGGLYDSFKRTPPPSRFGDFQGPQFSNEELAAIERERERHWHPDSRLDLRRKR